MTNDLNRRDFVKAAVAVTASASMPRAAGAEAPAVITSQGVRPVVIADLSGIDSTDADGVCAVARTFAMIVDGADVIDALVAGASIPELDPDEIGVGFGGLPNADGIVQLDACLMHGPRRWAGGVAALEGVRTPSHVAKAVAEYTDHHLLAGAGAQEFARSLGFTIEDDLNTERSRALWLEWRRRMDPDHYLDPANRTRRGYDVGLQMLREGLLTESEFWGTISCEAITPAGDIGGVTSTSGLAWKIPGRTGDSPILGAGQYVDNDVGAAGSTGRGEANLYHLSTYLIVEELRRGSSPTDAGLEALRRIRASTVERRLLNSRGLPAFNVRFFVLNKRGAYAGVSLYAAGETEYAVCTEHGPERKPFEALLDGAPTD